LVQIGDAACDSEKTTTKLFYSLVEVICSYFVSYFVCVCVCVFFFGSL